MKIDALMRHYMSKRYTPKVSNLRLTRGLEPFFCVPLEEHTKKSTYLLT